VNQYDHIVEALEIISAWNIPDEQFTQAVKDWACLLAKVTPDELWDDPPDNH
jgi:hypothetical protein